MKQKLVTEIHEIELSSVCSLACTYCPHPTLKRAKAHMPWETFERTLEHVRYYVAKGTQVDLSLTGIGEAILNPRFVEMMAASREAMGNRKIILSTNGTHMTPELAREFNRYNVGVYVSLHRPEVAGPALEMLDEARVMRAANYAFVDSALDWAGQVEWHVSAPRAPCGYLSKGWAVVRQDGAINACCMDAHGLYKIATVWDEPGTLMTHPTPLCAKCNFRVPDGLMEAAA
jgi:hypothetical protein